MAFARILSLLLLAGLAAVGACSEKPTKGRQGKTLARLTKTTGSVSHRAAGTLRWDGAKTGLLLALRDAVKTGRGASAVITFEGGSQLELAGQTLIIVEAPPAAETPKDEPKKKPVAVARVESGTVRSSVAAGTALDVIGADGKRTRIVATKGRVKLRLRARGRGRLEIAALDGAARISVGGKTITLGAKHVVDVENAKIGAAAPLPNFPELVRPAVDARFIGSKVSLAWRPVPGASRYHVQLSNSLTFSQLIGNEYVATSFWTTATLAPGRYTWRVSSVDDKDREGEFGFARRLTVLPRPTLPPLSKLLSPRDTATLVARGKRKVAFRWRALKGSREYELVVARDATLERDVVARRKSHQTTQKVQLRPGRYHWGVFALDGQSSADGRQRRPLFTAARTLDIRRYVPPRVKIPNKIDRWR